MLERLLLLSGKYPLDFISDISSIFPILIGLANYKVLSKSSKLILLFFGMYLLGDTWMIWLGLESKNNLFILNLYPLGGILLLTTVYFSAFDSVLTKRIITGLAVLSFLICLVNIKRLEADPVGSITYRLYIIILALLYFNKILSDMRIRNILIHNLFWISSGIIIYATGTFFISIFSKIIFNPSLVSDELFDTYWNINNILFLFLVTFSSIGIWFSKYEKENLL